MLGMTNSIQFDVDDPRSSKIAEAIANKTAKKILNILAEGEKSASDIASELDAPLNTVTYNLSKLVEAGLVEKSKKFFWSSKGKKMEFYKLSNKRIIISPKSWGKKIAPIVAVLAVVVVALIAVMMQPVKQDGVVLTGEGDLKNFADVDEMKALLEDSGDYYGGFGLTKNAAFAESAAMDAAPSAAGAGDAQARGGSAEEYSTTNIQVEGVDEPDFLKNDGEFIYIISGKKLVIVDAFPADEMKIVSEVELENYASNLFLNGDKLVVFMNKYEYSGGDCLYAAEGKIAAGVAVDSIGIMPPCGGVSRESTIVQVYDVSDRSEPEVEKEFEVSGNYHDARMVGDNVYLLTNKYINLNDFALPYYSDGVERFEIQPSEIYYFDYYDSGYVLNSVTGIDLNSGEIESEVYMMGYSSTIYVSEKNIYVTMRKSMSQIEQLERYVDEVLLEVLPEEEADEVREIMNSDDKIHRKSREVNEVLQDYSEDLEGREQIEFLEIFSEAQNDFYEKINRENDMTIVHRISIDELEIEYDGSGEVPGQLLNQFSMDEHEGYFRVVTTSGEFWRGESVNNLYVLDENLEIVGKVEDLAKGERIYSARFMGEKAYMVTFRQVDPLYVIDVSVPEEPKVLGYLKVTGYSGYLHPYDETHLIGVGQEATEEGRVQGVKISLFDVSDFANPKEIGKYEVKEGQWSHSDAIYDHKAFLFDRERELLVMPVSYNTYEKGRYEYWQGAYVFNVNLEGIELKGKIAHEREEKESEDYYYYGGQDYVRRSLFMDDVLYTISNARIKANVLSDLSDVREVKLPQENYYPVYY